MCLDSCQENTDAASSPSPSPMSMRANEGFSKDQTLSLIDLMRQHFVTEGEGLPKTLKDLNAWLKSSKANKNSYGKTQQKSWAAISCNLYTLADAYKKSER